MQLTPSWPASGQNSTITGTLAGQVVMEGFRRILRILAWLVAVLIIGLNGWLLVGVAREWLR